MRSRLRALASSPWYVEYETVHRHDEEATLVGPFAILLHAYGETCRPSVGSPLHPLEQNSPASLESILGSPPAPLQIVCQAAPLPASENGLARYRLHKVCVEAERIRDPLPSTTRTWREVDQDVSTTHTYNVAEGPYLALELIHTHLSEVSRASEEMQQEHEAALALFLHAVVLLAPDRPELHLLNRVAAERNGEIVLTELPSTTLEKIRNHPEFLTRWQTFVALIVHNHNRREELVRAAIRLHQANFVSWARSERFDDLATCTEEQFGFWIVHSLVQFVNLFSPLVPESSFPPTVPSSLTTVPSLPTRRFLPPSSLAPHRPHYGETTSSDLSDRIGESWTFRTPSQGQSDTSRYESAAAREDRKQPKDRGSVTIVFAVAPLLLCYATLSTFIPLRPTGIGATIFVVEQGTDSSVSSYQASLSQSSSPAFRAYLRKPPFQTSSQCTPLGPSRIQSRSRILFIFPLAPIFNPLQYGSPLPSTASQAQKYCKTKHAVIPKRVRTARAFQAISFLTPPLASRTKPPTLSWICDATLGLPMERGGR
ncbi:hypothetical protein JCM16303_000511 [Sporobolomyces ruberrimus]